MPKNRVPANCPSADEAVLIALSAELRAAVSQAKQALREGLAEADVVLANVRAGQSNTPVASGLRKART